MAVTETTLNFISRFDNSGAQQAVKGNQDVAKSLGDLGNQAGASGIKMDSLIRRMERPLGALVFSGMADDLMNMGQKGESTTMMLERGLHAVGMGLMYINPMWGIAALGAGALFDIFEKINHVKTADEIIKESKAIQSQGEAAKNAAENLKGFVSPDVLRNLEKLSSLNQSEYETTLKTTGALQKKLQPVVDDYNAVKKKLDLGASLTSLNDKERESLSIGEAQNKKNLDAIKILSELGATYTVGKDAANAFLEEQKREEKEFYSDLHEALDKEQKLRDEYNRKRLEAEKKTGEEIMMGAESFWKDFVTGNEKNLDKDLVNWIDSYATKLYAAAAADVFIDPEKAAGEFAGATALFALGTTFGGGGGAPSSTSGAGSTAVNNSGGTGTTVPGTNLTFIFQGGDPLSNSFMAQFLTRQNTFVQNSNGMVIATHAVMSNGQTVQIGNMG